MWRGGWNGVGLGARLVPFKLTPPLTAAFTCRGETLNVFLHIDAVYSLSVNPVNDNVFASSSDDGRVLIWDTRGPPNAGEGRILCRLFQILHRFVFERNEI